MIVRELVTRLGFSVQDANLKKYESGVNNIKNSAEAAADSFRNMFAAFLGFSALKSLGDTADKMQSMQARVGMLPQTIGEAGEAFDVVGQRASDARQSIDAYGNLYIKLQNAGKDFIKTQEEGLQVTDTLSKALVVGGATAQEQSSAMLQFAQAIGSGVLQGDELRAMGEAAPQFMDELAKAIGVPRDQIKKMGSDGKLTSKMVIEAVKKMSSVFDEKFKQMPMTIGQAITIVGNKWSMFINDMNRKSEVVTDIANFILNGFDSINVGIKKMVDFFGGATQTIKFFGIAIAAALSPLAVNLFVGAILTMISPLGLIIAGLTFVGLAIEDVYTWMEGGDSVIGEFLGNIDTAAERFKNVITIIKLLTMITAGFFIYWAAGFIASGAAYNAFVATAIGANLKFAAVWIATHAKMAVAAIAAFWPMILLVGLIAGAIAALLWLWDNFQDVMDAIYNLSIGNWEGVADAFKRMVDKLKGYWDSFKQFFGAEVNTNVTSANVSPATAGAAAASAGGVGGQQVVTINQTLPPGTPQETAEAAKGATQQAMAATDGGKLSRQMGAYQ